MWQIRVRQLRGLHLRDPFRQALKLLLRSTCQRNQRSQAVLCHQQRGSLRSRRIRHIEAPSCQVNQSEAVLVLSQRTNGEHLIERNQLSPDGFGGCFQLPKDEAERLQRVAGRAQGVHLDTQLLQGLGQLLCGLHQAEQQSNHRLIQTGSVTVHWNGQVNFVAVRQDGDVVRNLPHSLPHQGAVVLNSLSQPPQKVRHPVLVVCQRSFVRHREVQDGLDRVCHVRDRVFDRPDGAADSLDDTHDQIPAPGVGALRQTDDEIAHSGERVLHHCHYGLHHPLDAVENGQEHLDHRVVHRFQRVAKNCPNRRPYGLDHLADRAQSIRNRLLDCRKALLHVRPDCAQHLTEEAADGLPDGGDHGSDGFEDGGDNRLIGREICPDDSQNPLEYSREIRLDCIPNRGDDRADDSEDRSDNGSVNGEIGGHNRDDGLKHCGEDFLNPSPQAAEEVLQPVPDCGGNVDDGFPRGLKEAAQRLPDGHCCGLDVLP